MLDVASESRGVDRPALTTLQLAPHAGIVTKESCERPQQTAKVASTDFSRETESLYDSVADRVCQHVLQPIQAFGEAAGREVQEWKAALVALETQLRTEMRTAREQDTRVSAAPVDDATIRRVQQLIAEIGMTFARELAQDVVRAAREREQVVTELGVAEEAFGFEAGAFVVVEIG